MAAARPRVPERGLSGSRAARPGPLGVQRGPGVSSRSLGLNPVTCVGPAHGRRWARGRFGPIGALGRVPSACRWGRRLPGVTIGQGRRSRRGQSSRDPVESSGRERPCPGTGTWAPGEEGRGHRGCLGTGSGDLVQSPRCASKMITVFCRKGNDTKQETARNANVSRATGGK